MQPPPKSSNEISGDMRNAIGLLQAGKSVAAEELMLQSAAQTRRQFGAGSHPDALAQNELASILLNLGQRERAIAAYQEAISGPDPVGENQLRDRLTFLMSLGQALALEGRLEEAEEALLKGLQGRESFYGREHAGYAFGLEPLAEVVARREKLDVALEMIEECVGNFWRNGHSRLAGAIAIRAHILKRAANPQSAFAGFEKLPRDIVEEISRQAIVRSIRADDLKISRQVLADLADFVGSRLGSADAMVIQILIAVSNVERKLEKDQDPAIRQGAIRRLISLFESANRENDALQAELSLALAQSDAGDRAAAGQTYEQALARAQGIGDGKEIAQVLRNYGLLLAEQKDMAAARQRLREAVEAAQAAGDPQVLGRSLIALGIFLQHNGESAEASALLRQASPLLDQTDPDAITARSHLRAIEQGGPCGCGEPNAAIADSFRAFVMAQLPEGLLKDLEVTLADQDFSIGVHLAREASQDELDHINRVVQHALEDFRRKIATP